jgi:phosphatidylinositol-3,4,5-trisphosphate 3-phosphatase and dual-specificity protein phosphatase PTEN
MACNHQNQPLEQLIINLMPIDSSASTAVKENSVAPAESNKGTGSNDKDEVFSDSDDGEDGSSKERKERTAGGGQGSVKCC